MPFCPICNENKFDDSYLQFRLIRTGRMLDYVCERCLNTIRHSKEYILGSRFKVVERSLRARA